MIAKAMHYMPSFEMYTTTLRREITKERCRRGISIVLDC